MKIISLSLFIIILTFSFINPSEGVPSFAGTNKCDISGFEWLTGVWVMETRDSMVIETWSKDSNWIFTGKCVTIKPGGLVSTHTKHLMESGDAQIVYLMPGYKGKGEVSLTFVASIESRKFIFDNFDNDFPQKMMLNYKHRPTGDYLSINAIGIIDGKPKDAYFDFKRICK